MGEREMGLRHRGLEHLGAQSLEVALVIDEIVDMAAARLAGLPARAALSAPVEGDDRKAAPAQILDGLEIFLDEFRPPLKDADGRSVTPSGIGLSGVARRSKGGLFKGRRERSRA
jgi:hypothetical protein